MAKKKKVETKQTIYECELNKLTEIFNSTEESKQKLVEGLIQDAAFLYAENWELRQMIKETGSVITNPKNPLQQKTLPSATQYLKNSNSYAVIIKALNGILNKSGIEDDDDLSEYE